MKTARQIQDYRNGLAEGISLARHKLEPEDGVASEEFKRGMEKAMGDWGGSFPGDGRDSNAYTNSACAAFAAGSDLEVVGQ